MMLNDTFPPVSRELVEALEKYFPNILPPFGIAPDEIVYRQGQQHVVRFLRLKYEDQLAQGGFLA